MVVYIYDANLEFKHAIKTRKGIIFANSTIEAPDLKKYPQDEYKITFNKQQGIWEYALKRVKKPKIKPEVPNTDELSAKYSQKIKLENKYKTYYDAEFTARLLNLEQDITTKRLDIKKAIDKLEAEIEEIKNGQN